MEETDVRYEKLEKLGEGTYGIVYKARDRETNEVFCGENLCVDYCSEKDKIGACG